MNLARIASIGTAVPKHQVSQDEHFEYAVASCALKEEQTEKLRKIYDASGISFRYTVIEDYLGYTWCTDRVLSTADRMNLFKQHALDLSLDAVNECLEALPSFDKKDITHLISFSCTGMYAPGLDIELTHALDLNYNIERTCINFMGCYAAFNAIKSAYHIVRSQPDANVLLVGTELCSIHNRHNQEMDQLVANALFGDGAAAVLISSRPSAKAGLALQGFYSEFSPAPEAMVWKIGDEGFHLKLSSYVPVIVEKGIAELTSKLLQSVGPIGEQELLYAIHPGGTAILKACEKALNITKAQNQFSYKVLNNYGNMSSVTILFVLKEYMNQLSKTDGGQKILSCAFGPGVTIESMLLEVV